MSEAAAAPSAPAEQAPAQGSVQEAVDTIVNEGKPEPAKDSQSKPTEVKKYKIDGKEVGLDPAALKRIAEGLGISEDEFVRDYGNSANATRKAQEVAKLRKEIDADKAQIQQMFDDLKSDPKKFWALAKQMGHDPEKLAEERVWEKIQYEKMSPEARAAMEAERRAEAAERKVREIEEENNKKLSKEAAQAAEAEIETDVLKILELSKRKADPGLIRRVAEIIESYMIAKKAKPSHEYVVGKLRQYRDQEFSEDLNGIELEEFANKHPAFVSKLQDYLVKKARGKDLPSVTPNGHVPSKTPKASPERQTIDQFFKNL